MFNDSILIFPNNIVASMSGFKAEELFDAVQEADKVPNVSFR
jgi:hypothetical protein